LKLDANFGVAVDDQFIRGGHDLVTELVVYQVAEIFITGVGSHPADGGHAGLDLAVLQQVEGFVLRGVAETDRRSGAVGQSDPHGVGESGGGEHGNENDQKHATERHAEHWSPPRNKLSMVNLSGSLSLTNRRSFFKPSLQRIEEKGLTSEY